jgi:hypothetical protein
VREAQPCDDIARFRSCPVFVIPFVRNRPCHGGIFACHGKVQDKSIAVRGRSVDARLVTVPRRTPWRHFHEATLLSTSREKVADFSYSIVLKIIQLL